MSNGDPRLCLMLEKQQYVEAAKAYQQQTGANWLETTTWLSEVAGQVAVEQVNAHLSQKRFDKLVERVEALLKAYGMDNLLKAMIHQVDIIEKQEEERGRGELPYLRLLSIDLVHTLNNYKRRYDALEEMEMVDDEE